MRSGLEYDRQGQARARGASQRGLLNDFTRALGQQMFYWGRDVLTGRNLLMEAGFEKRVSMGLQGTSCYRLPWRGGFIELHGACAGWYAPADGGEAPGFLFIRTDRRCYAHDERTAVVPGRYEYATLRSGSLAEVMAGARFFARWLTGYEQSVLKRMGANYRQECQQLFAKLEASREWLEPEKGRQWLRAFGEGEMGLERARR